MDVQTLSGGITQSGTVDILGLPFQLIELDLYELKRERQSNRAEDLKRTAARLMRRPSKKSAYAATANKGTHKDLDFSDVMTINDATKYLHITRHTLVCLYKQKKLPFGRIDKMWVTRKKYLDEYIEQQTD
jgi:hypothetical protein